MKDYQEDFIKFLISAGVLTFGDFTTKSGRKTPYFVNTGNFNTGKTMAEVGRFYAKHISESNLTDFDVVFGPAYKGIPLAVTTGCALSLHHNLDKGVSFDRKEAKAHGDKGVIVGHQLKAGDKALIVEDVVTAGTTLREIVPRLRDEFSTSVNTVVIAVDRAEKGTGSLSAVAELEDTLSISIKPIITIHDIVKFLESNKTSYSFPDNIVESIEAYLDKYGA